MPRLNSRWFGGVRRDEAEQAIAQAEERSAALERELEQLREVARAQQQELAELREQESLIASVLLRAQANAEEIQAAADREAQERLREAERAIEELRERTRSSSDQILAHVQAVLGVLEPAASEESAGEPPPFAPPPTPRHGHRAPAAMEEAGTPPTDPEPRDGAPLWPDGTPDFVPSASAEPVGPEGNPRGTGLGGAEPEEKVEVVEVLEPDDGSPGVWSPPEELPTFELVVRELPTAAHAVALERRLIRMGEVMRVEIERLDDQEAVFVVGYVDAPPDLVSLTDTGVEILAAGAHRVEVRLPSDPGWAAHDNR